MGYPKMSGGGHMINLINEYAKLKYEYGSDFSEIEKIISETDEFLKARLDKMTGLPVCENLAAKEPDDLAEIKKLRKPSERRLWKSFDENLYADRLKGALYGRFAGCILGAAVEFWSIDEMEAWAKWIGDEFPGRHYWSKIKNPNALHYGLSPSENYTLSGIDGVPVDDDIAYTLLGLLIAEDCGLDFDTKDVGNCWLKYLPYACTAEDVALKNLKKGIPADKCGAEDNP